MEKMLSIIADLRAIGDSGLQPAFRDFDKLDWCGYSGAEPGSKIAHGAQYVFILAPDGTLSAIDETGETVLSMTQL